MMAFSVHQKLKLGFVAAHQHRFRLTDAMLQQSDVVARRTFPESTHFAEQNGVRSLQDRFFAVYVRYSKIISNNTHRMKKFCVWNSASTWEFLEEIADTLYEQSSRTHQAFSTIFHFSMCLFCGQMRKSDLIAGGSCCGTSQALRRRD